MEYFKYWIGTVKNRPQITAYESEYSIKTIKTLNQTKVDDSALLMSEMFNLKCKQTKKLVQGITTFLIKKTQ